MRRDTLSPSEGIDHVIALADFLKARGLSVKNACNIALNFVLQVHGTPGAEAEIEAAVRKVLMMMYAKEVERMVGEGER